MIEKPIYLLVFLLLVLSACSRKSIMYCTNPNYTAFCFEIQKKNKFKYYEASCTDSAEGKGKYEIIKDSIIFHFKDHKHNKKGESEISKIASNDSVIINLTVVDIDSGESLIGSNAAIYEKNKIKGGRSTNFDGKAILETSFNGDEITIELSYINYFPIKLEIDQPGEYHVTARMVSGLSRIIKKQDWKLNLIKLNKDSMVYRHFEEGSKEIILTRKTVKKKKKNAT